MAVGKPPSVLSEKFESVAADAVGRLQVINQVQTVARVGDGISGRVAHFPFA